MNPSILFVLAIFSWSAVTVIAAPTKIDGQRRGNGWLLEGLVKRATGNNAAAADNSTTRIWVPIVAVILVVIAGFSLLLIRRGSNVSQYFARAAGNETGVPVTTELTAAQLTGSSNNVNGTTTTTANGDAAARTRRPRRPRRTPSQISTTSLPAYMKEPGEQELVVIRGPQDMEDVPLHAVEMPEVNEDEDSVNSRYSPMPQSPTDMPLLHNDDEHREANAEPPVTTTTTTQPRISDETTNRSDESTSSLARVETTRTDELDPRGATPSYFEAVDLGEGRIAAPVTTASPETSPTASNLPSSSSSNTNTNRRSTFRLSHFFGNRNGTIRGSTNPPPGLPSSSSSAGLSHNRGGSGGALSLTTTLSRQSVAPNGHRPSQSNGSLLSLVHKKSTPTLNSNHLNSPSMISLSSISSPLSHTLVRTEFTYPKSGPTPEQLKLISSRDSFARFGVPYGEDAIAYASSSRADLNNPPPEFEVADSSPRPGSRLRTESPVEIEESEASSERRDSNSGEGRETGQGQRSDAGTLTVNDTVIQVQAATPSGSPSIPVASLPAMTDKMDPVITSESTGATSSTVTSPVSTKTEAPSASAPSDSSSPSSTSGSTTTSSSSILSSSSSISSDATAAPSKSVSPAATEASTSSPSPSTPTSTPVSVPKTVLTSKSQSLSSKPSSSPSTPTTPSASQSASLPSRAPPTSFKAPVTHHPSNPNFSYPESRAESRASSFRSVQSFATANESLAGGATEFGEFDRGMSSESESESVYHSEYLSGDDTETEREEDSDGETVDDERSRPGTPTLGTARGTVAMMDATPTRHFAEGTDSTVRAAA